MIKVCGMRSPGNIRAVAQLPIDMMGFIFYPKSSRYVEMSSSLAGIVPDTSGDAWTDIGDESGRPIDKVGVFVDATVQDVITHVVGYGLDAVQLHGSETPTYVRNLISTVIPDIMPRLKVLKAISISSAADFGLCSQYEGLVDMFVFDTKCSGHGGSGVKYDWALLDSYRGNTPFLLSGGIGEDDVERIKAVSHPQFAGVDLNSRFETAPGVKDVERLRHFIGSLRS